MKRLLLTLSLLCCAAALSAQGVKDVRINEIQVLNTDGLEDMYGDKVGWVELHNTGHSVVDIGGMYLRARGKEYRIPKGDPRTVLGPLGYVIFYAEGTSTKGTFHTNFRLDESDFIEFSESRDGKAVSRIDYKPGDMAVDVSYGWMEDREGVERLTTLPQTTPLATNDTEEKESKADKFARADPNGVVMAISAMSVVFAALVMLYLIFRTLGRAFVRSAAPRPKKAVAVASPADVSADGEERGITGEEFAAIAVALYRYSEDLHDIENTVLTINRGAKAYSPWSSKIYGLRQIPDKR